MPYGQLVPGMAYLVRRLLENSSNESFLRAGFVKHVPPETLLAPPGLHQMETRPAMAMTNTTHAHPPADAAAAFHNEPLTDFSIESARSAMQGAIDAARSRFDAGPARVVPVVIGGVREDRGDRFDRPDPSDTRRLIATVSAATPGDAARDPPRRGGDHAPTPVRSRRPAGLRGR
jgi:RHH-type proline utilization regulon transcriptional repressor/proline dehydrogenase/delta 1-pyrroline-5-carboxylate dehydrogenase